MDSLASQGSWVKVGNSSRGCKISGLFTKCKLLPHPQRLQTRPELFPCSSEYTGADTRVPPSTVPVFSSCGSDICLLWGACELPGFAGTSPTKWCLWGKERRLMEFQAVPLCGAVQGRSVEQGRLFAVCPPLSQLAGYGSCRSRTLALASLSPHSQNLRAF